jgi:hypothetical protein
MLRAAFVRCPFFLFDYFAGCVVMDDVVPTMVATACVVKPATVLGWVAVVQLPGVISSS